MNFFLNVFKLCSDILMPFAHQPEILSIVARLSNATNATNVKIYKNLVLMENFIWNIWKYSFKERPIFPLQKHFRLVVISYILLITILSAKNV